MSVPNHLHVVGVTYARMANGFIWLYRVRRWRVRFIGLWDIGGGKDQVLSEMQHKPSHYKDGTKTGHFILCSVGRDARIFFPKSSLIYLDIRLPWKRRNHELDTSSECFHSSPWL